MWEIGNILPILMVSSKVTGRAVTFLQRSVRRGLRERRSAQVAGMENKQRDKWSARMAGWLLRGGFEAKQGSSSVEILTPHFDLFLPACSLEERIQRGETLMRTSCRPSVRYHSSLFLFAPPLSLSFGILRITDASVRERVGATPPPLSSLSLWLHLCHFQASGKRNCSAMPMNAVKGCERMLVGWMW